MSSDPLLGFHDTAVPRAYAAGMIAVGAVLAGKYQIERVLGQGGMGVVVAAQHLQLGQLVALKFLLPDALRSPDIGERFLREARAAVRLKSEHVGRVIDVGTLDSGAPYLVMEYLEGEDLESFLRTHQRLPIAQAVDFVLQAGEAIAEAHSLGIIHRDLKPANLFLTVRADGTPVVKVLDFGISKATQESADFSLTRTAALMGSPGYMSPEQLRSARDVDARTDVWALGVILFELVTGAPPFSAETLTQLTLRVALDPTPPLGIAAPAGFEDVLRTCLEKAPEARYASVTELAAALVPFGPPNAAELATRISRVQSGLSIPIRIKGGVSSTAPTAAVTAAPAGPLTAAPTTLSSSTGVAQAAATLPATTRRRPALWLGAGALIAAGIAAAVMLNRAPPTTAPIESRGAVRPAATERPALPSALDVAPVPPVRDPTDPLEAAGPAPPAPDAGMSQEAAAPPDPLRPPPPPAATDKPAPLDVASPMSTAGKKPKRGRPGRDEPSPPPAVKAEPAAAPPAADDFSTSRY